MYYSPVTAPNPGECRRRPYSRSKSFDQWWQACVATINSFSLALYRNLEVAGRQKSARDFMYHRKSVVGIALDVGSLDAVRTSGPSGWDKL